MRILYVTTIGITMRFFKTFIRRLLDEGYEVDIATNEAEAVVPECYREWGCRVYPIETSRSPLSAGNIKAIRQLKTLVEKEHYDIVHCHTPIAAMCTRLACRKARKNGTKVLYTAHGFHFFKGAPLTNWLLFFPIEWMCSFFTDVLITINKEDYAFSKKHLHAKKNYYVPGVGLNTTAFSEVVVDKQKKREEMGVSQDATVLISVGELNENKNQEVVIRAMAKIQNKNLHYFLAGVGEKDEYLKTVAKECGVSGRVHLLGFRKDIKELLAASDIFCFPSKREGLPVSLMEAMAAGLPCIASKIRGNVDLIKNERNGFLVNPEDVDGFAKAIQKLSEDKALREAMKENNKNDVKKFDSEAIAGLTQAIYQDLSLSQAGEADEK